MVIYCTTNLINGKKYIGLDKQNNSLYFGSGKLLIKAIKKYGETNFKKEIIEYCNTLDELYEREKYWISFFNAVKSKNFYNIAEGGNGGNTYNGRNVNDSNTTHNIKSKNSINMWKSRYDNVELLNKHKELMIKSINGAKWLHKKTVQLDKNMNIIKIWDSPVFAERNGNFIKSCIIDCCNKKRKTHKDCIWMYYEEFINLKNI